MPPPNTPVKALGPKESLMFTDGPFKGRITDKYQHFVDAGEHSFHGWMGRNSHLGAWIVYGSNEDQNGGPTKQHNAAHFERILLKILTCSHYGAAPVTVAAGEEWRKVYGPWMLYLNEGTPDEMWADVQRQAKAERDSWPAPWLKHPAFAPDAQRGRATGKLVVRDPADTAVSAAHAWVGLAEPSPDWQQQSKNYQYWTRADADGRFEIPHVRPGRYTLYAFVDGALGEFRRDDVVITAAASTDLGTLTWTPERHGRQLWQIGTPDRTAREFRHGDDFRHWGLWLKYPEEFPHDVDFVIGKSHERTDWNYAQVNVQRDGAWVGTTWRVRFAMPAAPSGGTATLRVALAGAHRAALNIAVNGRRVAQLKPDLDNAMVRAGIHGQYELDDVTFNASLLRAGENTITFEQARGGNNLFNVMYDALRLELDEATPYRPAPIEQPRRTAPVTDGEAD
jgi:rhamnogalacturonan endolyase